MGFPAFSSLNTCVIAKELVVVFLETLFSNSRLKETLKLVWQ
jgi:hypothetical protein